MLSVRPGSLGPSLYALRTSELQMPFHGGHSSEVLFDLLFGMPFIRQFQVSRTAKLLNAGLLQFCKNIPSIQMIGSSDKSNLGKPKYSDM
jgi:hypothetical protein